MTEEIRKQAGTIFEDIFKNKRYSKEINFIQKSLGISKKEVKKAWIYWDTGIREYSNEIYSSESMRFVMYLHNLLNGNWHEKRQKIILNYLEELSPKSICEIGFGVPQKYVREFLSDKRIKIILADFEKTSIKFAENIFSFWNICWKENITLLEFNMSTDSLPLKQDVYIFQDSIEHSASPTDTLKKFVASADTRANFLFSLPVEIESPIPEHHICWKNKHEIKKWLSECGLKIVKYKKIEMNKDLDLFSHFLHPDFHEVIIWAKK